MRKIGSFLGGIALSVASGAAAVHAQSAAAPPSKSAAAPPSNLRCFGEVAAALFE